MTAIAVTNNYYNEYQGVDYLSRTFQSSLRFSPSDVARRTISQENFTRQREKENRIPKTPWGRKCSYGGIGAICLPDNHRPKGEPPVRVQKGHRHLAAGACTHPRYVATDGKYAVTSIRRSNLRATDELIESPTKVDVTKHTINLKFPAEHPFATHIERASVFPPYDIPANQSATSVTEIPAAAPDIQIISKSKGSAYRHEKSSIPLERERKPMEWHEGPNFFQLLKGGNNEKQMYYPIPLKSLDPNMKISRNISSETARALKQLRKAHWTSTYQRDVNRETVQSKYVQCLNIRDNPHSADEDIIKSSIQGKRDNAVNDNHRFDINPGGSTQNVEKSVHFAEQASTTNNMNCETNGIRSDKAIENIKRSTPGIALQSPSSENIEESSPRTASRAFMSASYPPDKSRQTPLNVADTKADIDRQTYSDELIRGWSRSDIRRRFNRTHQDKIPDLRRKPDLRITTNERRHRFPDVGDAGSYVWNGLGVPHLDGIMNE